MQKMNKLTWLGLCLGGLLIAGCDNDNNPGVPAAAGGSTVAGRAVFGGDNGFRLGSNNEQCGPRKLVLDIGPNGEDMFGQCSTSCDYSDTERGRGCDFVKWEVDNPAIVSITVAPGQDAGAAPSANPPPSNFLRFDALSVGKAKITATVNGGTTDLKKEFEVEVVKGAFQKLIISDSGRDADPHKETIILGESHPYNAILVLQDGTQQPVTNVAEFRSRVPGIAAMVQSSTACGSNASHADIYGNCLASSNTNGLSGTTDIDASYCGLPSELAQLTVRAQYPIGLCVLPGTGVEALALLAERELPVAAADKDTPAERLALCRAINVDSTTAAQRAGETRNNIVVGDAKTFSALLFFEATANDVNPAPRLADAAKTAWSVVAGDPALVAHVANGSFQAIDPPGAPGTTRIQAVYADPALRVDGTPVADPARPEFTDSTNVDVFRFDGNIALSALRVQPKFVCAGFAGLDPNASTGDGGEASSPSPVANPNYVGTQSFVAFRRLNRGGQCTDGSATPGNVDDVIPADRDTCVEEIDAANAGAEERVANAVPANCRAGVACGANEIDAAEMNPPTNATRIAATNINVTDLAAPALDRFGSEAWFVSDGYWNESTGTCVDNTNPVPGAPDQGATAQINPSTGLAGPKANEPLRLGYSCVRRTHTLAGVTKVDGATLLTLPAVDDSLVATILPLLELCQTPIGNPLLGGPLMDPLLDPLTGGLDGLLDNMLAPLSDQLNPVLGGVLAPVAGVLGGGQGVPQFPALPIP